MSRLTLVLLVAVLAGCDGGQPPKAVKSKGHGHIHERAGIMLEDIELPSGKCHAGLTAHLDEKGNELDVLFETFDEPPKPVAIPLTAKLTATATRTGDDKQYTLEFKPAELDERKTDPDGQCSRFAAEAKWMKPEDTVTVNLSVEIDGQLKKVAWIDFSPKKFAHKH